MSETEKLEPESEPKRPECSAEVTRWLANRHLTGLTWGGVRKALDEMGGDVPPRVGAWAREHGEWVAARERWASAQRIDVDHIRGPAGCWRMLGGAWLPCRGHIEATVETADGSMRYAVDAFAEAQMVAATADDETFRRWALGFYELHNAAERARGALAMHCLGAKR